MKKIKFFKPMALSLAFLLVFSCSKDEDELETWELEVNQLKSSTSKYADVTVGTNEGFIDVTGYVANMGHHYRKEALVDEVFELTKPEYILYLPDENNILQMVAVEYSVIADANNPATPPEGFTGDQDTWTFVEAAGEWRLHVWTILENPDGIFKNHNLAIGD